jgi:DNA-binding NarL/FixJ family response regulator
VGSARRPDTIKVFIADDHAIVRQGLASYLGVLDDIAVVGEASDGDEAVAAIADLVANGRPPDVALVDLVMPGLDGVGVAEALQKLPETPRLIVLSGYGDVEQLRSALGVGVSGYILKSASAEAIATGVREVSAGGFYLDATLFGSLAKAVLGSSDDASSLTARERDIVALVAKGMSNKEIASTLHISERTARTHVSHLLNKLKLRSRIQLAIWAHNNGFPLASPDELARPASS